MVARTGKLSRIVKTLACLLLPAAILVCFAADESEILQLAGGEAGRRISGVQAHVKPPSILPDDRILAAGWKILPAPYGEKTTIRKPLVHVIDLVQASLCEFVEGADYAGAEDLIAKVGLDGLRYVAFRKGMTAYLVRGDAQGNLISRDPLPMLSVLDFAADETGVIYAAGTSRAQSSALVHALTERGLSWSAVDDPPADGRDSLLPIECFLSLRDDRLCVILKDRLCVLDKAGNMLHRAVLERSPDVDFYAVDFLQKDQFLVFTIGPGDLADLVLYDLSGRVLRRGILKEQERCLRQKIGLSPSRRATPVAVNDGKVLYDLGEGGGVQLVLTRLKLP